MATTFDPIATTTLGSTASSITFSSIPATYTDIRIVIVGRGGTGTGTNWDCYTRFNTDSGANYSTTVLSGSGSAASSFRITGDTGIYGLIPGPTSTAGAIGLVAVNVFSYAGSTYKTTLSECNQDLNGSGNVNRIAGLWRNTAAITTISLHAQVDFATGTTATLYGIKNA
jgi:hypothetical protein